MFRGPTHSIFALLALLSLGAAILTGAAAPARAQTLPLPAEAWTLMQALGEQCPDCEKQGFSACGTHEIGYGSRFGPNLFQGAPKRGYLVGHVMTSAEYAALVRRETDLAKLTTDLGDRFRGIRLVVIDENFAASRVLGPPGKVEVVVPQPLHQCLRDPTRAWSCCSGEGCAQSSNECCEKSLGSSRVEATWSDPETGEQLRFRLGRSLGESSLVRSRDGRNNIYFCLTDSRGRLR